MHSPASKLVLRGPIGIGGVVEGKVLVSTQGFNARYDLDRQSGTFSRPEHDLYGQDFRGRILVFGGAKGGIATSWALYDLKQRGMAPLGLVFRRANPVVAQGCALAELPLLDQLDPDPVNSLANGDYVRLVPEAGELILLEPAAHRGAQ